MIVTEQELIEALETIGGLVIGKEAKYHLARVQLWHAVSELIQLRAEVEQLRQQLADLTLQVQNEKEHSQEIALGRAKAYIDLEEAKKQLAEAQATIAAMREALASDAGKAYADRVRKLEEALRFYGDQHNWPLYLQTGRPLMPIEQDRGAIARRALDLKEGEIE